MKIISTIRKKIKELYLFFISNKPLMVILLAALFLRLWGIKYGFPILLNKDETSFVRTVIGLRFNLDPYRFDWPHTHFYLNFIFYTGFYFFRGFLQVLNLRGLLENIFPILWHDPIVFYLISRIINAFLGALTVIPLYLVSKKLLKSKKLSLLVVLLFSFIPYHVYHSHFGLLDTAMTFWITIYMYFAVKLIEEFNTKNFIYSGLFLGLAFGTKYNALFFGFILIVCILYAGVEKGKRNLDLFKWILKGKNLLKYVYSTVTFFVVYLITNPTVITNFDLFWSKEYGRGFLFLFENVGSKEWFEYPPSLYENLYTQSMNDFGFTLYVVLAAAGIMYLFFCFRNKVTNITLLFSILLFLYISKKDRNPSHYFLPLYPLLSITAVYFVNRVYENITKFDYLKKYKKIIFTSLFSVVLISPVFQSLKTSYELSRPDTRNLAYSWLQENVSKEEKIYFYRGELEQVPFINLDGEIVRRVERDAIEESELPFYLFIGVSGLTYEDLMEGNRDTEKIDGNISEFVEDSDLVFYKIPERQKGPPVFIFKVYSIQD